MAPSFVDTRLGELLQNDGTLTEQDIKAILAAQKASGDRFGEVASRLGLASEQDVRRALARQIEFPVLKPGDSDLSPELVVAYQPYSKRAEELRTLRSELMLRWFGRNNRILAVVELRSGNGSSTLAANLAVAFSQLGERTLLIDANLRTPSQHMLFGVEPQYGLVDCLKHGESLQKCADAGSRFQFSITALRRGAAPQPAGTARACLVRLPDGDCARQIRCRDRRYTADLASAATLSLSPRAREARFSRSSAMTPGWRMYCGSRRNWNRRTCRCSAQ